MPSEVPGESWRRGESSCGARTVGIGGLGRQR